MKLERHPTLGPLFNRAAYVITDHLRHAITQMPEPFARRIGASLGRLARRVMRPRLALAKRQAEEALGPGGSRCVAPSFESLGQIPIEVARIPVDYADGRWRRRVDLEGLEMLREAVSGGRGVVAVSGHIGNWEIGAAVMGFAGFKVNWLLRPLENPLIQESLNRHRAMSGQHVITKWGGLREAIHVLRRGEILSMLVDQDARDQGVFVPFFGKPASTLKSPAILSMRTGAPIVTFTARRLPGGRFHVRFEEPYVAEGHADQEADVARATARFTSALEARIREAPEQWLWVHRRWKTRPPGEVAAAGAAR